MGGPSPGDRRLCWACLELDNSRRALLADYFEGHENTGGVTAGQLASSRSALAVPVPGQNFRNPTFRSSASLDHARSDRRVACPAFPELADVRGVARLRLQANLSR